MSTQLSQPPDGNQNRTGAMIGMATGPVTVSFIFVVLRLYTRLCLIKSARWDDWTILLALLGSIIGGGLDAPEIRNGFGRHQYYLNDHQIQEFKKYTYGEWLQTFFTLMVTKVSICLLLLRISPNKRIIRPIQSLVVFLVLSNVVLSLAWILQCIPVDGAWDATKQKTAKCLTQGQVQRVIISQARVSVDNFLWRRLVSHFVIHLRSLKLPSALSVLIYHSAEVNIGIVAACIPTLLPLYRLFRDKIITAHQSSTSATGRFAHLFFGQGRKTDASSHKALWKSRKKDEFSVPQNAKWANSPPHVFLRTGKVGAEDVEMQTRMVESQ
ncbi:MAG: hypothetical protein Q9175_005732 [Cornicularia normoerica]